MKLIKEIKDRNGKLYFRRWRLANLYFFYIEKHEFWQGEDDEVFDKDGDLHSHPHRFLTYIAKGGYIEVFKKTILAPTQRRVAKPGSWAWINWDRFHCIYSLLENYCCTYTIKFRKRLSWGYVVNDKFVPSHEYRERKNPIDKNKIMDA